MKRVKQYRKFREEDAELDGQYWIRSAKNNGRMIGHNYLLRKRLLSSKSNDVNISSSSNLSSKRLRSRKAGSCCTGFTVQWEYGVLVSPTSWVYFLLTDPSWKWPNLAMVFMSNISIFTVFIVEKLMAWNWLNNQLAFTFYLCIFSLHIFLPAAITWILEVALELASYPLYSVFSLSVYVILFLKLTSYAHTNYWYRCMNMKNKNHESEKENLLIYPRNLTLRNLYYFIFAPTFCYELQFPRTNGRRKAFIIKRTAEFGCLALIIIALCQQWVAPLLRNSVESFTTMNFSLDFWNAETLPVFWKTWNIPVHRWALRHIYWPMVFNGFSKMSASCAVFFVSAFFTNISYCAGALCQACDLKVSVPLHMFRFWAYLCMMAQIPLSIFTEKVLKGGRFGNIVMWLSLILGQPLAILMYVHDWYVAHYPHSSNMSRDNFRCCVINDDDVKRWFIYFDKSRSTVVATDGMTSTYEKMMTTKDRIEFAGNVSESLLEQSWQ
ncbi:DGAT1 [Dirofilaria immitis]|nr:DGAT1 [Dirofilaria immitis]